MARQHVHVRRARLDHKRAVAALGADGRQKRAGQRIAMLALTAVSCPRVVTEAPPAQAGNCAQSRHIEAHRQPQADAHLHRLVQAIVDSDDLAQRGVEPVDLPLAALNAAA